MENNFYPCPYNKNEYCDMSRSCSGCLHFAPRRRGNLQAETQKAAIKMFIIVLAVWGWIEFLNWIFTI